MPFKETSFDAIEELLLVEELFEGLFELELEF